MNRVLLFLFVCWLALFTACSNENNVREKVTNWDPTQYTVKFGDTLYSLAWRYDLDFKSIARWNNIQPPFTIYPGQRLKMTGPVVEPVGKTYLFGRAQPKAAERERIDYSNPDNIPAAPPVLAQSNSPAVQKKPVNSVKTRPEPGPRPPQKTTQPANKKYTFPKGKINWSWPIKGKVISTFAANNHSRKGIDVKGKPGQKINSAGDGVVVYSGAGLISYGKLIIIKHSERFLSAYAYNKKLLVREGARIKRGQAIAIIGKNLNVTNLLHFEIRKDGKPVNPLLYLP